MIWNLKCLLKVKQSGLLKKGAMLVSVKSVIFCVEVLCPACPQSIRKSLCICSSVVVVSKWLWNKLNMPCMNGLLEWRSNLPGFEYSSNMQMYYTFGNHIYSLSSMTTFIFLVWKTYFYFLYFGNNYRHCTLMSTISMKF